MAVVISLAIVTYLVGIVAYFLMGAFERDAANISLGVWRGDSFKTSSYAKKKIEEATEQHAKGCRMQVRAFLWPIDLAAWLKRQILTAFIGANGGSRND